MRRPTRTGAEARLTRGLAAALLAAAPLALVAPDRGLAQDLGEPIPYSAILEAPDDLELNFRYARQQIAAGRLPAAASALERLLIQRPDWAQVRLLHGVVLFRLGQTAEADRELAAVDVEALSSEGRATLNRIRSEIARAQQTLTGNVGVTFGIHQDSNRNNFPLDGRFQVNLPGIGDSIVIGQDEENADFGYFGLVDGRLDYDTGLQRLSQVSISAAGLIDNQVEEDDLDAISGQIGLSAVIDTGPVDLRPSVVGRQINLDGDDYLTGFEGRLRAERRIGTDARLTAFVEVLGGYEDFGPVTADPFAEESSGGYLGANIGATWVPFDTLRLTGSYGYIAKDAEEDFEAFDAHSVRLDAEFVVTSGVSVAAFGSYARQSYDAPDPFISLTEPQEDDRFFGGGGLLVSIGPALRGVGVETPALLTDNLVLSLNMSYRRVHSNFDNFEYDNLRFGASITKRFFF